MPHCNLCSSTSFQDYRGRPNEQCVQCGSKARHRVGWDIYQTHLFPLFENTDSNRLLHLAPERCFHDLLKRRIGSGYITADASPGRYPYADCLRLFLPDDLAQFPAGHFTAIIHNHVLEHLPGHYGDHLRSLTNLLCSGGRMIFSIPGPYLDRPTIEGGEHLSSDSARKARFLQEDHYKLIGSDFPDVLSSLPDGSVISHDITDSRRAELSVRPSKSPFFIWQRI